MTLKKYYEQAGRIKILHFQRQIGYEEGYEEGYEDGKNDQKTTQNKRTEIKSRLYHRYEVQKIKHEAYADGWFCGRHGVWPPEEMKKIWEVKK